MFKIEFFILTFYNEFFYNSINFNLYTKLCLCNI